MATRKPVKRGFGQIRRLPSKRWQAFYTGPDTALHYAPTTFDAKVDAEAWLADERRLIASGTWAPPKARTTVTKSGATTLGDYAESWLRRRELKPTTRTHYRAMLDDFILPRFGTHQISSITPLEIADWHHDLATLTGPTYRAHTYALMRTICRSAVADDVISASPCRVPGAGRSKRVHQTEPATLPQLEAATAAMPPRLHLAVLLAAWCALRSGEIRELRRKDIDLKNGFIRVRRGVTVVGGEKIIGTPKSEAGIRDVAIPPHLVPLVRAHINEHAQWGRDGLLFPSSDGTPMPSSSLAWHWEKARTAAGRPDLRFHDLRHTGAVLAAATGATLAELMARLGHSTPAAAMRYQHAARGRDAEIAARLSEMVNGAS